jgi:hypothetical protein
VIAIGIRFDHPRHNIDATLTRRRFYLAVAALVFFILAVALLTGVLFAHVFLAS